MGGRVKLTKAFVELVGNSNEIGIHGASGYLLVRRCMRNCGTPEYPVVIIDAAELKELEDELKRKTDALKSIAKCGREEPRGICRTCIAIATDALTRPAKGKRK